MKATDQIDLSYRPKTYWQLDDPFSIIAHGIKGEARRQWATRALRQTGEAPEIVLPDLLDHASLRWMATLGPHVLGGEHLPPDLPGETTIARIVFRTLTGHVVEVRARPSGDADGAIAYRVVDEMGTDYRVPITESCVPLTQGELIQFIEQSMPAGRIPHVEGLILPVLRRQFVAPTFDRAADQRAWIDRVWNYVSVSSEFYPELELYGSRVVHSWLSDRPLSVRVPRENVVRPSQTARRHMEHSYVPTKVVDEMVQTWALTQREPTSSMSHLWLNSRCKSLRKHLLDHLRQHGVLPAGVQVIGNREKGGAWNVDVDKLTETSRLVERVVAEGREVEELSCERVQSLKGNTPVYLFGGRYYMLIEGDLAGPYEKEDYLLEVLEEEAFSRAEVVAYHEWDSGAPGAGAGITHLYRIGGAYFLSFEAGLWDGPYEDKETPLREVILQVSKATVTIWEEEHGTVYPEPSCGSVLPRRIELKS